MDTAKKRIDLWTEVQCALANAQRSPGWNNRSRDVHSFNLAGNFGHGCTLYVVPFRRWAYRRQELATAVYTRDTPSGAFAS